MTAAPLPAVPRRWGERLRRRRVLWVAGAAGAAFAGLVALLAVGGRSSGSSSPLVGKPAPPLQGRLLDSRHHLSLSHYAGRWVLVNFGASWCADCRLEMPQLKAFARTESRYHAVLLTVDEDGSDLRGMAAYMRAQHATWPVLYQPTAGATWGVGTIPDTFIVDPQGTVAARLASGVNAAAVDKAITRASAPGSG